MYNLASISLEIAQSPPLQGAEGPIGEIGWLWVLVFLLVVIVVWSRLVQPVETPDIHTEHGHEHGDGEAEAAHAEMEAAHAEPESEPEEPHPVPAATTAAAVAVPEEVESEAPSEPDNLAKLEGIGPKINTLLQDAGITTFAELAETDTERLDEIVDAAGLTFADVSTWPEQAGLAAAGDWEALEKLQADLKGGRRQPDNLAKLEGIGPKINKLLQDAGITTFAELAETATERLDEIVDAAGLTFADVSTWPEQARLAAAEDWEALEKLQEELKGGRRS